jgi:hypothetical protein
MKKLAATALLTAFCAISTAASATPITLTGSMGATALSNATYNAIFSGKSVLPQDYTINALSFSFSFTDDGSDSWTTSAPVVTNSSTGNYSYDGFFSWSYSRDKTVNQTVTKTSDQESAILSLAGIQVGSGATALNQSSSTSSNYTQTYDGYSCSWVCYDYYTDTTTNTTTVTKDYTGAFTISGTVTNQQILDKLLQDDQLAVSLNVMGDLKLTAATLLLDYTKVETGKVPEPSTIVLALGGLLGLGVARRRGTRAGE